MLDTLTTLSWPYLLALFGLSAQWLLAVWQQARLGRRPWLAYLAAPGLAALVAAPLAHAEPLFGVGAALLLIAAYAGGAYRFAVPAPSARPLQAFRRQVGVLIVVLALMLALVRLLGPSVSVPALSWPLWTGLGLYVLASLLSGGAQRRYGPRVPTVRGPGLELRFGPLSSPAWPDLELRFDGNQARLYNIGSSRLLLAGWSPSGANCWIRPQDASGQPLGLLPKGSVAVLAPWPVGDPTPVGVHGHDRTAPGHSGVRVWYVRQNDPETALVFRADWTPLGSSGRVLN